MSWYTSMYIGIMDKNNKIKPWGPYDANGNLRPVFCHSRSFTSDLKERFYPINEEHLTDELIAEFPYETGKNPEENEEIYRYFGYLPISELPNGSYIKHGYCKLDQISNYESDDRYFDGFYDVLTTAEYLRKFENEIKFGAPKPKIDIDGEEYYEPSCAEYTYYSWADYNCEECEAFLLREACEMLKDYNIEKDYQYVAIKTEG